MSAQSVATWRAHYTSRGEPFPLAGPALPPGWTWVCAISGSAPHRAEHNHARLSIVLGRKRAWRVEIGGRSLRTGDAGPVREFSDPAEAARAAVAVFTGARLGAVVGAIP